MSSVCGGSIAHSDTDEPLTLCLEDITLYQQTEEQTLLPDHVDSLAVEAFLRMCSLDFKGVERTNAAEMSPSGRVPWVKCKEFIIPGLQTLVEFFGNAGISLTKDLDAQGVNDVKMYSSLVNDSLLNAEHSLTWADRDTYSTFTKVRYGSVYPWPLSWMVPRRRRKLEMRRLAALGWEGKDALTEVENCLRALSARLKENRYFVADTPTQLDAMVFAHTLSILMFPQSSKWMAPVLQDFPVLVAHCRRVDKEFFGSKYADDLSVFNATEIEIFS